MVTLHGGEGSGEALGLGFRDYKPLNPRPSWCLSGFWFGLGGFAAILEKQLPTANGSCHFCHSSSRWQHPQGCGHLAGKCH